MTRSPVNRRDPSGTRKIEAAEIRRERELISAYTDAMARVAVGDDPKRMETLARMSDMLKEDLGASTDEYMGMVEQTTDEVTSRVLNNLNTGIKLGAVSPPREEIEALRMNLRTQVADLGGETLTMVTRNITEGYQEGLGADEITERIIMESGSIADRAERIVRTETMRVADTFAKARYDAAGCDGYMSFPTDDDRLCEHCIRQATGGSGTTLKIYGKNEPMVLPWHPNCRCVRLPHFEGVDISI